MPPIVTIQTPLDQANGSLRLLSELRTNLQSNDFVSFKIITAFAKEGPLLKLKPDIDAWKAGGKRIEAIFGIDEKGTSTQALLFAITHFNTSFIAKVKGGIRSTFHPKIYLFEGNNRSIVYIGSNNLTPGGMETNAETFVKLELTLPADQNILNDALRCWTDSLTLCLPLTTALLTNLTANGDVIDETQMKSRRVVAATGAPITIVPIPFPNTYVLPPTPMPRSIAVPKAISPAAPPQRILNANNITALVLQILPHANGEIFLSKIALNQNNAFFGFPFTGLTVPKIATNPSYPQRLPDPVVNIYIYDATGTRIQQLLAFALNTVFYTTKSDIRITVPATITRVIPPRSILVMEETIIIGLDYEIHIYYPGSASYNNYLAVCNQTMPSGGGAVGRRFGWI